MDITATELFWKLVTDKAGIKPATEPQVFTQAFTPIEATWEKFRTIKGTGRLAQFLMRAVNSFV